MASTSLMTGITLLRTDSVLDDLSPDLVREWRARLGTDVAARLR